MDIERAVVSRALGTRDIVPFVEASITEEFFPTGDHATAWRWMLEYWREHGRSPTLRAFRTNFPAASYRVVKVEEPTDFLIATLRDQRKRAMIDQAILETVELTRKRNDTDTIFARIQQLTAEVGTEISPLRDMDLVTTWKRRLDEYIELTKLPDGMRGITLGFPSLDRATSGAQKGQLLTYIGEPKVGKSTLLLRSAIAAHEAGNHVLFIGFEMSNDEQAARYDSMVAGVDHSKLLTGKLGEDGFRRLRKRLKALEAASDKRFVMSQDISSATTVSGLQAKVQQYSPDIVFVDGAYLMDDEYGEEKGTPRQLTNVTRGLKRLAQQADIPVAITTQVLTWKVSKKDGLKADAIGYTSSFAQDSDLIVGLEHDKNGDDSVKRVRVILSRNTARMRVDVRWDWHIGVFEELPGTAEMSGSTDLAEDDEYKGPLDV